MSLQEDLFGQSKRSMTGKRNRRKGVATELLAAKTLQEWTALAFERVPLSGGLGWRKTQGIVGDLVCQDKDEDFCYTIEVKTRAKLTNKSGLPNSSFGPLWKQACADAQRAGKEPFLMAREDGMPKGVFYIGMLSAMAKDALYGNKTIHVWEGINSMKLPDYVLCLSSELFEIPYEKFVGALKLPYLCRK